MSTKWILRELVCALFVVAVGIHVGELVIMTGGSLLGASVVRRRAARKARRDGPSRQIAPVASQTPKQTDLEATPSRKDEKPAPAPLAQRAGITNQRRKRTSVLLRERPDFQPSAPDFSGTGRRSHRATTTRPKKLPRRSRPSGATRRRKKDL